MTSPSQSLSAVKGTIALAGAGKMGGALLAGWLNRGVPASRLVAIEPMPSAEIKALAAQGLRLNPAGDVGEIAALVLAVKPQTFAEAAKPLKPLVRGDTLVVSIMAGMTIAKIVAACGGAVVRSMPNTPASIGHGITVAVPAANVSQDQRAIADALLRATGPVEWVEDEGLLDAVTAVSGSGPAYVFLLAEELARAGVAAGLPAPLATRLARETVVGSAALLKQSELDAATLRENVSSPGGTTLAALEILMGKDGLSDLMTRAVAAATRRSKELAG
jgi:pyrroline-5-carboxylate reductase